MRLKYVLIALVFLSADTQGLHADGTLASLLLDAGVTPNA